MTDKQFKTITKKLHFYNQGGIKNLCTMTETTLRQVMEEAAGVTQAYIRKLVQHDVDQQNKIALLSAKVYKLQKAYDEQQQSNECHDCAKFDEMPKGPRCKTCDNGSRFQKKEEA